ncbi:uncharacterized protein LOC108864117 [Galendromus occidentalis]|uniref:Uncharacterized protein LOC108864117 n=1 Tax=Galendromus occidentalis TaxID=34638 RepID=A0AAJ7L5Q3_9ACAR|nr:uncharacterized protein LOC108864117 [Galendromus occidentalis]
MNNRQRLIPMIKTVVLCGRQNIALRCLRDNGLLSDYSLGGPKEGNFRALLSYRLDADDSPFEEHLASPKRNANYISGKFQNKIIRAIGRLIRKKIVNEVKEAKFFSILARDISFCDVTDKTGAGLARAILDNLKEEELDVRDIRGQGYDGDSGTGAYTLLNTVCNFDFLISLYFIQSFASLLLSLPVDLQKKELDIFGALGIVDTVLSVPKERRGEAGPVFTEVFGEATFPDSIDIEIEMPRVCHRQAHRGNHSVYPPEEYFRTSAYIPYIDALITEFTSLFEDTRKNAAELPFLIPKFTVESSYGDMREIFNFYESDLN